ncbi:MAG TPA: helix-turn-helix domain-containing GNAT family N-acetyltransferase [Terriglobales bacterium]|nr:helix-turn-helix domain-containing GNAT family N-acetyltransferase [Terriglobales bacterium]
MQSDAHEQRVQAVRQFSRFYTQQLGVLNEKQLGSKYSLTEVRVLFELAQRKDCTARQIGEDLGLDAGYLSRILNRFARARLIARQRSKLDARNIQLRLTSKGRSIFQALDRQSSSQVADMLDRLSEPIQEKLIQSLHRAEESFIGTIPANSRVRLRSHRPGDIGWVIYRHGALYAEEYGWDESFEALVAEVAAQFIKNFDLNRERCWIAELNGESVGSIFLVKYTEQIAKLRLLFVEPHARGFGIGRKLVQECIDFARQSRYKKVTLWTQSCLLAARKLYREGGFKLVKEEPQRAFGADLVSEVWELEL